jgi:hypothetical protein
VEDIQEVAAVVAEVDLVAEADVQEEEVNFLFVI